MTSIFHRHQIALVFVVVSMSLPGEAPAQVKGGAADPKVHPYA
ncbi:hypothetical protein N9E25_11245 [Verrucomicrobiales bacterium]|nr:hypothetical protein [Verrucomicrobiales bacterium]MDA9923904.1 hypothetical protein [Verrucomicrobiales bacterium]